MLVRMSSGLMLIWEKERVGHEAETIGVWTSVQGMSSLTRLAWRA